MPPGFNHTPGQDRGPRVGATLKDLKKDSSVFRLFKYIFKFYKVNFLVVLVCIVVSSLTSLASPSSGLLRSEPPSRRNAAGLGSPLFDRLY